jgi:hypothetical protein
MRRPLPGRTRMVTSSVKRNSRVRASTSMSPLSGRTSRTVHPCWTSVSRTTAPQTVSSESG